MNKLIPLNNDDAVSIPIHSSFAKNPICMFHELRQGLAAFLHQHMPANNQWLNSGVPCQILRTTGGGWQKGKFYLRVELEFVPDEPDEPLTAVDDDTASLDSLRVQLNQSGN